MKWRLEKKTQKTYDVNMDSNPTGVVASTSDVHELPMEMNEMKIREDKTDDHEDTTKIFRALNYMLRVIGIFHRDTKLWNLLVWLLFYFDELMDMVASNLAPISVNFLTQAAKVIFAIVMLIFQLRHCLHLYFYVSVIEEMSTVARFFNQRDQTLLKL
ncbi:shaggy-related kinase 11 [Striga asiatica]|uniref:Shaggy-related kinase 11 n=1 Tax=Striga asiatica TaxID=4170 RepID=A0A5A7PQE0_STRAF|nr:shaggy-related kinase 11 [Striga asiatica]